MSRSIDTLLLASIAVLVVAGVGMAQIAPAPYPSFAEARFVQSTATPKRLGIGREADPGEIAGWDIDIRPDGLGLPIGRGTVKDGEVLYMQRCAGCHGEFGEGTGRWPILSGGVGTLASDVPVKSIGSYWPYASTLLDFIRRAKPFGNAQSLSNDELYAVVAYVLFLNDLVDENFVLTPETFGKIRMPNMSGFHDDNREKTERAFWNPKPCMTNCKAEVKITGRARTLDVTPADKVPQRGVE